MLYLHLFILCILLIFLCFSLIFILKGNLKNINTSIKVDVVNKNEFLNENISSGLKNTKNKKYHVPKFMLELYEKNKWIDRNTIRPDVVRSLIPKHAGILHKNKIFEKLIDKHLLVFDLPLAPHDEQFLEAELKILTLVQLNSKNKTGVRRIITISAYDFLMNKLVSPQQLEINYSNNSWLTFNLTNAVSTVLKNENRHLKIILTIFAYISDLEDTLKLSLMPDFVDSFQHDYPILLLSYTSSDTAVKVRKKRSIEIEDYEEDTNKIWEEEYSKKLSKKLKRIKNSCKRKPLYIDFEEIDYDVWIVQPKGYEAYQCQGKCYYPVAEHLNPTKHAIVQALLHSVTPSKVTRSCCVPTALDSISILYVDEKGVLTYRYAYKDMVVTECGCR